MTDRQMTRNSGNPDAQAEVPDSQVTNWADYNRAIKAEQNWVWDGKRYVHATPEAK